MFYSMFEAFILDVSAAAQAAKTMFFDNLSRFAGVSEAEMSPSR
jgi:hypothetical protein